MKIGGFLCRISILRHAEKLSCPKALAAFWQSVWFRSLLLQLLGPASSFLSSFLFNKLEDVQGEEPMRVHSGMPWIAQPDLTGQ